MNDQEYAQIRLRASLCPSLESEWEAATSFAHWAALHGAASQLRTLVSDCFTELAKIEQNKDLSVEGRKRKKHDLAQQTLAKLDQLPSIEKARNSVAAITQKWDAKINSVLTVPKPEDAASALLLREVRDRFATVPAASRLQWLDKHGSDPLVPSALLKGPLTGLSDAERALLQSKVEALADPVVIEAKRKVTRAMAELERAHQTAPQLVAQCAGLPKGTPRAATAPDTPKVKPTGSRIERNPTPQFRAAKHAEVGRLPSRGTLSDDNPKEPAQAAAPNWPHNSGSPTLPEGGPNWNTDVADAS